MTKSCAGTILTSQFMDCQTRAIGKAIRPLFAEPVTLKTLTIALHVMHSTPHKYFLSCMPHYYWCDC